LSVSTLTTTHGLRHGVSEGADADVPPLGPQDLAVVGPIKNGEAWWRDQVEPSLGICGLHGELLSTLDLVSMAGAFYLSRFWSLLCPLEASSQNGREGDEDDESTAEGHLGSFDVSTGRRSWGRPSSGLAGRLLH
jgi:hypothetical protein